MSDTTTCPNCSASLPAGATFCTSCGTRTEAAAAPAAPPAWTPPPAEDATRVDGPALSDSTQVFSPPPTQPDPPAYAPPPAAPAPWQPAEAAAPPAPAWTPPAPQAPPGAPAWQQPAPAPGATAGWGAAPPAAAPAWGAPAPAPASSAGSTGGSPIGGIVALVGGVLTLISIFTAWFGNNVTDATITGWDLTSGDKTIGLESKDPYLLLVLGILALVVGVALFTGTSRSIVRVAAVIIGVAVIGVLVRDWLSVVDLVKDLPSTVKVNQEFGYFLGIAGGAVTIVAAVLPGKKAAAPTGY